ncbi:hypothetical protein ACOSP7_020674 [Xanthoceras sorbifolium]
MSKFSSPVRFDVEKFDGRINFGLWQIQVKNVLTQSGLHKVLKGKPIPVSSCDFGESITKNGSSWKKKNSMKNTVCWGGAVSAKGLESDAGSVSLRMEDNDFL